MLKRVKNVLKNCMLNKYLELKAENRYLRKIINEMPSQADYISRIHELELELREARFKKDEGHTN